MGNIKQETYQDIEPDYPGVNKQGFKVMLNKDWFINVIDVKTTEQLWKEEMEKCKDFNYWVQKYFNAAVS